MVTQTPSSPATESAERRVAMSYADYLAWHEHEGNVGEWVNGEVIAFVPPNERHQDIVGFLLTILRLFVRRRKLGTVLDAPFELRLGESGSSREPDILFLAKEHADRKDGQRWNGAADLAVEVISAHSLARDRREKLAEYARAGVPEYWLIDARELRTGVEMFVLSPDGVYVAIEPDETGRLHSVALPGFWLDPAWLQDEELPDEADVVRAITETSVKTD